VNFLLIKFFFSSKTDIIY